MLTLSVERAEGAEAHKKSKVFVVEPNSIVSIAKKLGNTSGCVHFTADANKTVFKKLQSDVVGKKNCMTCTQFMAVTIEDEHSEGKILRSPYIHSSHCTGSIHIHRNKVLMAHSFHQTGQ